LINNTHGRKLQYRLNTGNSTHFDELIDGRP
jgi:hypothetical protein